MYSLLISIVFSSALLINFKIFPKYSINTYQAISLNYIVCFLTGYVLMPQNQHFDFQINQSWTWYCLLLGMGFILTFVLSGLATQKVGMTPTSLANNLSLVIPVMASLLIFKSNNKDFDALNYLGLGIALVAVALSTYKKTESESSNSKNLSSILLILGVFLLYGITNTAINYLNISIIPNPEQTIPVTLTMLIGAIMAGIVLIIYRKIKYSENLELKNIGAALTLGIPNFLSFYFLIKTLTEFGNSGAFVYPIYNIGVLLLSSCIALVFFKEKISFLNKMGLLIAILAIVLISHQELFSK
jgi:drug/metabolite transporter (DMT)-like permease